MIISVIHANFASLISCYKKMTKSSLKWPDIDIRYNQNDIPDITDVTR